MAINFMSGLLQKNPERRMGASEQGVAEIMAHPFFEGLDWEQVLHKEVQMEWVPEIKGPGDVRQLETEFPDFPQLMSLETASDVPLDARHLRNFSMTNMKPPLDDQ
jgi:hypothetical protein